MKNVSRVVAVVAATALSAAGLVGTAATSANAAGKPLVTSYSCSTGFGDFDLPLTVSTALPTTAKAGKKVPAKAVTLDLTVPASVVGAASGLLGATELGGKLVGTVTAGKTKIGLSGKLAKTAIVDPFADLVLHGTGTTAAFKVEKAGTYTVKAPKTLKFTPVDQTGKAFIGAIECGLTSGAASKLGTIKVTK